MPNSQSLFEGDRLTLERSIDLTVESLRAYGERFSHWSIAYSGGKDSSATVTLVQRLIELGRVPRPESLIVLYADTRMELPPLQAAAMAVLDELGRRGVETRVVLPPLDDRFMVYMLGRGVPPPKNRFRWCTSQLKIEPMAAALAERREAIGEKLLMLTGVRLGESAARDARIVMSCSRDGAECGQGWFQESPPDAVADTLAPLVHWRVCHVWDWLVFDKLDHGFPTRDIGAVYGLGEEGSAAENGTRTGCVGCNLASRDTALDTLLKTRRWQYLAPFKRLKPLYAELTRASNRLRKGGNERRKDGTLCKNQMRLGPLTFEARRRGLSEVLTIQDEINAAARGDGRPTVTLINDEEHARILDLIEARTYPDGWTGDEVTGDEMLDEVFSDGSVQPLLADMFGN